MTKKVAQVLETVKDAILPAPTYKTTIKKFEDSTDFAAALVKGDKIKTTKDVATLASLGFKPEEQHEVEKVEGDLIFLKGGKKLMSEWFIPEVTRRERLRAKANRTLVASLANAFARLRWADFKVDMEQEIVKAKDAVTKAQTDLERAQNRVKQCEDAVVRLEAAKTDGDRWPSELATQVVSLVDQKLFTNFEIVNEDGLDTFIAYTGPLYDEKKVRSEYAIKVYPTKARLRVVVENVTPDKLPTDVPHNNGVSLSNVCFGDKQNDLDTLIRSEDWRRTLIMIRAFLEGNRLN